PDYLKELEAAESRYADLSARYKSATAKANEEEGADQPDETLSKVEVKKLRDETTRARRDLGGIEDAFIERLAIAVAGLGGRSRIGLVVEVLRDSLADRIGLRASVLLQGLENAFQTWGVKYSVTLRDLEDRRAASAVRVDSFMKELGYV